MKKIFFVLIAILTVSLSSCTKDRRINNKLDGTWNVTVYENVAMPTGSSINLTFKRGNKGSGTGTCIGTGFFILSNFNFAYDIVDEKLTMTHGFTVDVYTVSNYSSKEVTLLTVDGKKMVLEPK